MSKRESKARKVLEVSVMFEPSRLAADYLADAYAQVVPRRRRSTPVEPPVPKAVWVLSDSSSRREQA